MTNSEDVNRITLDVIIVLGAAVCKGGRPSQALRRRVLHGVKLLEDKKANYLLVTGGLGKYPPAEAIVMRSLALDTGVQKEKIILEEKGTSTFTNVKHCIRIMRKHNWFNAIVVSDSYHLFRATFVFRCFGIKVTGSAAKGGRQDNTPLRWLYYHLREIVAFAWYIILILHDKISEFDIKDSASPS
jgi:vancomycin permeability regulator SanA